MSLKHYWAQARILASPRILYRVLRGLFRAQVLRKSTLRVVHVLTTFECQARCAMCSVARFRRGEGDRLTPAQYGSIADQAAEMGAIAVTLLGGEPLLLEDLEEVVRTFKARHFYVSIVTNGIALTRDCAQGLKAAGLDAVIFGLESLDEEVNDRLRGFPGQCRRVKEAIGVCKEEGLHVGLCVVFLPGQTERYVRLAEFCAQRGLSLSLPMLAPVGSAAKSEAASEADYRRLRSLLKDYRHVKVDWGFSYFLRPRCPSGREKVAITCYGDVMGCTLNHISFGNVRQEPLKAIWERMGRFSPFRKGSSRCLAAFDAHHRRTYLAPLAQADESPVRFDRHPGITPESEPGLFARARADREPSRTRALLRRLWQRVASALIGLVQQFGPRTVTVNGRTFVVSRQVLNPKFYLTTEFMARHVRVAPDDEVLDVGTGSGALAVAAAQVARNVVAVDVNPAAVECARENVRRNGLDGIVRVVQSDLFSALDANARFDVILFSPPYFEGTVRSMLDRAVYDPAKALARRFFAQARRHLKPRGYVQMIYSSAAEPERVLEAAGELGWDWAVTARKKARFETLLIYKLTPKARPGKPEASGGPAAGAASGAPAAAHGSRG